MNDHTSQPLFDAQDSIHHYPIQENHQRFAMGIEYDGSAYSGWQKQHHADTVQGRIETALSKIADHTVEIQCAGRTDAGVHATGQVIHFDTNSQRELGAWTLGMNSRLPDNIAVRWVKPVDESFHARFSATARRYRYIIYNHRLRPAILSQGITQYYAPLDEHKMHAAAQALLGENDFTSFRAQACQSNTPWRNVHEISVKRQNAFVIVEIKANAFLHHMVRNIVGSLLLVGAGERPETWLETLLALKDRTQAAATAKPNGLYLVDVTYPEHFALPKTDFGPLFLV